MKLHYLFPLFAVVLISAFSATTVQAASPRQGSPDQGLFLPLVVGTGSGTTPTPIPYSEREAVLDAVRLRFAELSSEDVDADRQGLAAYIRTLPHIVEAGVAGDGAVWGRFADQRLLVVAPQRPPQPTPPLRVTEESSRHGSTSAVQPQIDLPGKDVAYVLNALGTCFQSPANDIATMLQAQNYTIAAVAASVDGLKSVKDAALFYIDTHGGGGTGLGSAPIYSLWTTTQVSLENDVAYFGDFASGHLVYMLAYDDALPPTAPNPCTDEWHYGITHSFVSAHMSFSPRSLVFFNGCSSMSTDAANMRQAFAQVGAATFLGWTIPVADPHAQRAGRFLFDRLLGSNTYIPDFSAMGAEKSGRYEAETPSQRPFPLSSVLEDMQNRQYDLSVYCSNLSSFCHPRRLITSTLQLQELATDPMERFGLLAPTIERAESNTPCCSGVDERVMLYLHGHFGSEPGEVTIEGQPVVVDGWTSETITATLPPDGAGSAGNVMVKVRNHTSNAVPLTEWRVQFHWREEYDLVYGPGPYAEVTCDLHFRTNFHASRPASGAAPIWPEMAHIEESQDSHCTWTMAGESTWTEQGTGVEVRAVLSGSGEFTWDPPQAPSDNYLAFTGYIEAEKKQIFIAVRGFSNGEWTIYRDGEFSRNEEQRFEGTGGVTMALDDGFNILPGTATYSWNLGTSTANWEQAPAHFAPSESTPTR